MPVQVPQVEEHVQGIGQHEHQDQGHRQADYNGWREGRRAVSRPGKLSPLNGKALDLSGERAEVTYSFSPKIYFQIVLGVLDP